jgi:hypothetical protein
MAERINWGCLHLSRNIEHVNFEFTAACPVSFSFRGPRSGIQQDLQRGMDSNGEGVPMKNVKKDHAWWVFFIWAVFWVISGCGGSKLEELETEVKRVNEKIHDIQQELDAADANIRSVLSENRKLSDEVVTLRNTARKLTLDNQILLQHSQELKEWSGKLVAGYGSGIWYMDDSTMPVFVQPMRSADVPSIAEELNRRFEQDRLPKILVKNIHNRTVRVGVDDEELLTQEMGSHGATSYLNAVVYSMGSVSGIDCVMFEFKGGDHAVPGEYCK